MLLFSIGVLLIACMGTNWVFTRTFKVTPNVESAAITALILALIITPMQSGTDFWFLFWASVLSMASKYILAIKGKHLINPVAIAVAVTYFSTNQSTSWWVGTADMLPLVLVGGLLLVRKMRKAEMIASFILTSVAASLVASLLTNTNIFNAVQKLLLYSPLVFFGSMILTEPVSTPPTRTLQIYYGAIIGILSNPQIYLGTFYFTPEMAILAGNGFSYNVSPKETLMLRLREKICLTVDSYEFVFAPNQKLAFEPGQYMEWTLGHNKPDSRGNRRYFTLASSTSEHNFRLGIRFSERSSSYKKALLQMKTGGEITASQLSGDFVLPADLGRKIVMIAGGIGITPFRSMIKTMLDTHQRRSVVLFYSVKTVDEILYKDIFDRAAKELGVKVVYTLTKIESLPASWIGKTGRITVEMIQAEVPDYQGSIFYLCGPDAMIESFRGDQWKLNVPRSQIKMDYFAGF